MSGIIDISPVVSERTAVWPGDVAFRRAVSLSIDRGDNIDLSSIQTTVHVGAHADAPSHFAKGGAPIGERPLDLYYGPCQVVIASVGRGERIRPEHLTDEVTEPRVLLRTDTFPDPDEFTTDFAALSPELVDHLAARGVRLVGIDTPSVDLFADRELIAHRAIARHDMANLECLALAHVVPGRYTLVALPLRLAGADASPVRAALLP
jgi:arylformamidase